MREVDSEKALELISPKHILIAPDLLLLEVTALLSRRVREGVMSVTDARADMVDLPRLIASITSSNDLLSAAFDVSLVIKHPIYDCIYLALAEKLGTQMISADAKLAARLQGTAYETRFVLLSAWVAV